MCGIGGVVSWEPAGAGQLAWKTASRLLEHRGPDGSGFLSFSGQEGGTLSVGLNRVIDGRVAGILFHRRLSILDLSSAGAQPMASPSGRFWIIYNGEIYNFLEIRQELERFGYVFNSHSDTEVILAAFEQWGPEVISRFVGMFAFAVLDTVTRSLFLARDPFGIKPLFYFLEGSRFGFASEQKALFPFLPSAKRVDPERLFHYMRFGMTDDSEFTLIQGIRQVLPAHYLQIALDTGKVTQREYWKLDPISGLQMSFSEAANKVRDLFLKNIELHLRSDVPVGACLSGGIDSSSIVCAMRHVTGPGLKLHSFTYLADGELSEEHWADMAGKSSAATMHKVRPQAGDLAEEIDTMIRSQDEPFVSTSMYAQYRVFRLVNQSAIKVVLDGQGADEMLAGYRPYLGIRIASLIRKGEFMAARDLWKNVAAGGGTEGVLFVAGQHLLPNNLQAFARKMIGKELDPPWLDSRWFKKHGVDMTKRSNGYQAKLLQQSLVDSLNGNLRALLRYEDRNAMAYSVESRVPFLTTELATFIVSLPEEYLVSPQGRSKSIFREAMRGIVPDAILDRRDKIGFATPEKNWLLELRPWVEKNLQSEIAHSIPAFDHVNMMNEWGHLNDRGGRYNMWTWRWVNLIRWVGLNDVQFS